MIRSSNLGRHLQDLWRRVALYGAVIGCALAGFFVLRLVSAGVRQAPHPVEVMVALVGLMSAGLGIVAVGVGVSLIRRGLPVAVDLTQHYRTIAAQYPANRDRSEQALDLVEADVVDIDEGTARPPSLPRGAQTLLILSMRRENAQDVISSLSDLYPVHAKYHGKMRARTLVWMNVLQIISFRPVARLSSLVAGIFVSPRF